MRNKKIALISPKGSFYFNKKEKTQLIENLPGFKTHRLHWSGLGTALPILASLTPKEYDIEIIDENIENIDYSKKYHLVAITAMTHQALRAYKISSEFRKKGIHTVIGGIHASFMYNEAKFFCDTVVIGEAENIWPIFLDDFNKNTPKKLYFAKDYPKVNFENLPIPKYDILKNKNYNIIWINSERGCPYDCEFCSVVNYFGKKIRYKSVENIVTEIKNIKNDFDRILIGFTDDNMFLNKKHTKKLLNNIKDLNIRWVAQSDITIGKDDELLKLLYDAGCHALFIGFESLNPDNLLNLYNKGKKLKYEYISHYKKLINKIQSNGIIILGSFIIGLDYDTIQVFDDLYNFIYETDIGAVQLHILTPLPGSRLRERLLEENRILPTSWDNYTFWDINYIPKKMTFKNLENGIIELYNKIYSKDRILKTANFFKNVFKKMI